VILGDKAQGAFAISDLTQLQDAVKFTLKEQRTIGPDQKFIFSLEP
jgi:riboflavin biosynthesis pyrimidine reductase